MEKTVKKTERNDLKNGHRPQILVPTLTQRNAIRPRPEAKGVNVEAARERGKFTVVDADELLLRFSSNIMRNMEVESPAHLFKLAGKIGIG